MSTAPITIVGAGISGLVLGRALLRHGRKAILYQRGAPGPRFAYGITLYPWAYRPLMKVLDLDLSTFRKRLAVDAERGGVGRVELADAGSDVPFRASRQKLEELLKEGLDVRYDHQITLAETNSTGVSITAEGKETITAPFVVDASGVHSKLRYSLSKERDPNVLPYVVFNGKRRVMLAEFDETYAPYLSDTTTIEQRLRSGTVLSVSIAEVNNDLVNLSYTYSRPARNNDELHKPGRALTGSEDIPEAFYTELQGLGRLDEPFASTFDPERVKADRILHWLMRTTSVSLPELQRLVSQGVIVIGDSAHAHPIVGGEGANAAIMDGLELADWIDSNGTRNFSGFIGSKHRQWTKGVRHCEHQLQVMHEGPNQRIGSTL